jgi:hypothetical protein
MGPDPCSTIVYGASARHVRAAIVDGRVLVNDFAPTSWAPEDIAHEARREAIALASRAGLK